MAQRVKFLSHKGLIWSFNRSYSRKELFRIRTRPAQKILKPSRPISLLNCILFCKEYWYSTSHIFQKYVFAARSIYSKIQKFSFFRGVVWWVILSENVASEYTKNSFRKVPPMQETWSLQISLSSIRFTQPRFSIKNTKKFLENESLIILSYF